VSPCLLETDISHILYHESTLAFSTSLPPRGSSSQQPLFSRGFRREAAGRRLRDCIQEVIRLRWRNRLAIGDRRRIEALPLPRRLASCRSPAGGASPQGMASRSRRATGRQYSGTATAGGSHGRSMRPERIGRIAWRAEVGRTDAHNDAAGDLTPATLELLAVALPSGPDPSAASWPARPSPPARGKVGGGEANLPAAGWNVNTRSARTAAYDSTRLRTTPGRWRWSRRRSGPGRPP
jgi:hypothetical protein